MSSKGPYDEATILLYRIIKQLDSKAIDYPALAEQYGLKLPAMRMRVQRLLKAIEADQNEHGGKEAGDPSAAKAGAERGNKVSAGSGSTDETVDEDEAGEPKAKKAAPKRKRATKVAAESVNGAIEEADEHEAPMVKKPRDSRNKKAVVKEEEQEEDFGMTIA